MQSARLKTRYLLFVILVVVPGFALSSAGTACADYVTAAHGNNASGVNRSGHNECPTGAVCDTGDCTHCHDTFDPDICGVQETMLFAELDNPDFCMECHTDSGSAQDPAMSGVPATVESLFQNKTYKHNVTGYGGLHKFLPAEETRTYLSANKHVECNDCHNPHTAGTGLHSSNILQVSASGNDTSGTPIAGAFGVEPEWNDTWLENQSWTAGGADSWPTTSSTATKEYQICLKCHSDYNTDLLSWGGSGPAAWTNLSLEFNPNKQSHHPVVEALPEVDPGYEYDPVSGKEYDRYGSNRLPPAFTSLLIGDSGLSSNAFEFDIYLDSAAGKQWVNGQWVNWGVRVGTRPGSSGNQTCNQVGRITSNDAAKFHVSWQNMTGLSTSLRYNTVYSIEYYAGKSTSSRSGNTVTDTTKNYNLYLPSLAGYVVVITDAYGYNIAQGTVQSNTATAFTVDSWAIVKGSVPSGIVGYYFSATGHTMMCSDCHSNDEISTAVAQGPHGSSVKWMLKGRNRAWPTFSAAENGTGSGTPRMVRERTDFDGNPNGHGLFCLNCHSTVSFSKDRYGMQNPGNVHHFHGWLSGPECVECHIMVPHGGAVSRLLAGQDADGNEMPARYAFNNTPSNTVLQLFVIKTFDPNHTGATGNPAIDPAGYVPGGDWCYVSGCHFETPHPSL
jgi:hypothetical protein